MFFAVCILLIIIVIFTFYRNSDECSQFKYMKKKAEDEDVYQQIRLAKEYLYPKDQGNKDYEQAQFYLEKAVAQGSKEGKVLLGHVLCECTSPNYAKAFELFNQSIKEGELESNIISYLEWLVNYHLLKYPKKTKFYQFLGILEQKSLANICVANFFLAELYLTGTGVPCDLSKAVKLYEKAANQGDLEANYKLFNLYYEFDSEVYDLEKAFLNLIIAAKGNLQPAYNLILSFAEKSPLLIHHPEIDKGLKILLNLLLKFADSDTNINLKRFIGLMHANGSGTQENPSEAFSWYEKAALQGCIECKYILGSCYEEGYGVVKNLDKAIEWYKQASGYLYADIRVSEILKTR
ncbi:hypothetical protein ABTD79_13495 [Acinetobacter baumannii]